MTYLFTRPGRLKVEEFYETVEHVVAIARHRAVSEFRWLVQSRSQKMANLENIYIE